MSRKIDFSIGEFYHIYNRGVDKRSIFLSKSDYNRFVKLLLIANSDKPIHLYHYRGSTSVKKLVSVGAWCLMPNHFHILLKEIHPNGISIFMHKLSTAYTMFFNKKYSRTGALFAGRFKAVHVQKEQHLKYLYSYIHLNPIRKNKKSLESLNSYEFSSFKDYLTLGRKEFTILNKNDFPEYFQNPKEHINEILEWINIDNTEVEPR